jgi:hypothetical protein
MDKQLTDDKINGAVLVISISESRGIKKRNVEFAELREDFGIVNDAHAGKWHRQISLLAIEPMQKIKEKGLNVKFGDFAENIFPRIKGWNN